MWATPKCTYIDCTGIGAHPRVAKDGDVWANLCDVHHKIMEDTMTALNAREILREWVKAQGVAEKAAKRC